MHYRVRASTGKCRLNLFAVSQVAWDECRSRIHCATMTFCKIVEDNSFMAFIEKQLRANAPDITGAANDENFHPAKFRRA
jgi:hypothetical protein